MFTTEVCEFLKKPSIARMSTIDGYGYPHTVPLWFDVEGDDIVIISDRNTRKIEHIARNPKGNVQIGGDAGDGGGYLFKGELSVEADTDYRWLKQVTRRYEASEQAEKDIELWMTTLDMIIIRLKVKRVIKVY